MTRATIKVHSPTNDVEKYQGNAYWQGEHDDLKRQKRCKVIAVVKWSRMWSRPRAGVNDHDRTGENARKIDEFQNKHKNAAKSTIHSQSAQKTENNNAK